jgi:hypothetical protein
VDIFRDVFPVFGVVIDWLQSLKNNTGRAAASIDTERKPDFPITIDAIVGLSFFYA